MLFKAEFELKIPSLKIKLILTLHILNIIFADIFDLQKKKKNVKKIRKENRFSPFIGYIIFSEECERANLTIDAYKMASDSHIYRNLWISNIELNSR